MDVRFPYFPRFSYIDWGIYVSVSAAAEKPAPGWVNSTEGFASIVSGVSGGRINSFLSKLDTQVNLVPVDAVVNATIALGYLVASQKW